MDQKRYPRFLQNLFFDEGGKYREYHLIDEHHVMSELFGLGDHAGAKVEIALKLLGELTAQGWLIRTADGFHQLNPSPTAKRVSRGV